MSNKAVRSVCFILLFNLLLFSHALGQWREINIGTRRDLTSLRVENDFVYTTSNDTLFFSNDYGETWTSRKISLPSTPYFFANDSVGYAFKALEFPYEQYESIVYKTIKGGQSWEETGHATFEVDGWYLQDENQFIIWGKSGPEYSTVWYTNDGGQTFSPTTSYERIASFSFNGKNGWMTAHYNHPPPYEYNETRVTSDYGVHWKSVSRNINWAHCIDDQTAIAEIESFDVEGYPVYNIAKTKNRGISWEIIARASNPDSLSYGSSYERPRYDNPDKTIKAYNFKSAYEGVAVGTKGLVLKYSNPSQPLTNILNNRYYPRLGKPILIDGSGSTGPNLSYSWTLLSQPGGSSPQLLNTNEPILQAVFDQNGTYRLQLTVTNESGSSHAEVAVYCGLRWKFDTLYPITMNPAIDPVDGSILIAEWNKLYSLFSDGTIKWTYSSYSEGDQKVLIDNDRNVIFLGYENSFKFDNEGNPFWKNESIPIPTLCPNNNLLIANGRYLITLDKSGEPIDTINVGQYISADPCIRADGSILCACYSELYCLQEDGKIIWTYKSDQGNISSMALGSDGRIYCSTSYCLYALTPTGEKIWQFNNRISKYPIIGPDKTVYFSTPDSVCYAVDSTGIEKWHDKWGIPLMVDDQGIIYTSNDKFNMIDPNGNSVGSYPISGIWGAALGKDSTAYVGSSDGSVYAVYAYSGNLADSGWPKDRGNNQNTGLSSYYPSPILKPNFGADQTSGIVPLTVQFSDSSQGEITSRLWRFGDGDTSTTENPSHTYSVAGTFSVSLVLTGPAGTDSLVKENFIVVRELPPVAKFVADTTSGLIPLTVHFTDQSEGSITNRLWRFGDGDTNTTENPSHTYVVADTFSVSLTVIGPSGIDSLVMEDYIIVRELPPVAKFTVDTTSGYAPLNVRFTDQSEGSITNRLWNFGDGSTSTEQNPEHVYTTPDSFDVSLIIEGPFGSDTVTVENCVVVHPLSGMDGIRELPKDYALYPNYPNPFNPKTTLYFALPQPSDITFKFFNVNGVRVDQIRVSDQQAGYHKIVWDASRFPSGTYIIRMETDAYRKTMKCLLLK